MAIAAKLYNKMILNRLVPFVGPLLRKNQNGFRRGGTTLSQILCLRRLLEEAQASNRDLALVFVDFSKAFDSVDREKMFEILKLYGIPDKIISAIRVLYTDTSSTILTTDGETPPFSINAGILQGDTLAPFLFIIVVDYVLRMSVDSITNKGFEIQPRRSTRHPAQYLTDTDFADDIALIRGRGQIGLSSNSRRVVFFRCHFMLEKRIDKNFSKKFVFGGLHLKKLIDAIFGPKTTKFTTILLSINILCDLVLLLITPNIFN